MAQDNVSAPHDLAPLSDESSLAAIDRPTWARILAAFAVAGASDGIAFFVQVVPPVEWGLDLATALLLFLILGKRWALLPGLIAEAIPGLGAFPVWILVVAFIAAFGDFPRRKK